jgi:hypothetical protein
MVSSGAISLLNIELESDVSETAYHLCWVHVMIDPAETEYVIKLF